MFIYNFSDEHFTLGGFYCFIGFVLFLLERFLKKDIIYKDYKSLLADKPAFSKFKDIEGRVYSGLTVKGFAGRYKNHSMWFCECNCGSVIKTSANALQQKSKTSCLKCTIDELNPNSEIERVLTVISGNYKLLSKSSKGSKYHIWCEHCNTYFTASPSLLRSKPKLRCSCSKITKLERELQIKSKCNNLNYSFLGWKDDFLTVTSVFLVRCNNNHTFETNVNKFIHADRKCLSCMRTMPTRVTDFKTLHNSCPTEHTSKYDYSKAEYISSRDHKIEVICKHHGSFWQTPDNHFNKMRGCPSCTKMGYASNTSGWFYIQRLNQDFIKFGITNKSPEHRMSQQSNKSSLSHKLLNKYYFSDGTIPVAIEKTIKDSGIELSVVSKDDMKDGYTETTYFKNYNKILKYVESFVENNKGEI